MRKLVAVIAVMLGFSSISQAGIFVDPYVGMESGKIKGTGGSADEKVEGSVYGLRLGYKAPVFFWGGLDVMMGSATSKPEDGSASSDGKRTTLGAVVGVNFPILFRAWASYGFSNEMKFDTYSVKGTNTRVGLGFTGLPFVSINLEMLTENYKDLEFGGTTSSIDSKNDSYILSVSLPLSF